MINELTHKNQKQQTQNKTKINNRTEKLQVKSEEHNLTQCLNTFRKTKLLEDRCPSSARRLKLRLINLSGCIHFVRSTLYMVNTWVLNS